MSPDSSSHKDKKEITKKVEDTLHGAADAVTHTMKEVKDGVKHAIPDMKKDKKTK